MTPSESTPAALARLQLEQLTAVTRMFEDIAADQSASRFHPHPFDASNAARVCYCGGRDLYFGLWAQGRLSGYGMLRGWDEGFDVPSLGIWVSAELRGTGAAKTLMSFLHLAARLAGSTRIRLKVHPDNARAVALYRSLGYVFSGQLEADGQMLGLLDLQSEYPATSS